MPGRGAQHRRPAARRRPGARPGAVADIDDATEQATGVGGRPRRRSGGTDEAGDELRRNGPHGSARLRGTARGTRPGHCRSSWRRPSPWWAPRATSTAWRPGTPRRTGPMRSTTTSSPSPGSARARPSTSGWPARCPRRCRWTSTGRAGWPTRSSSGRWSGPTRSRAGRRHRRRRGVAEEAAVHVVDLGADADACGRGGRPGGGGRRDRGGDARGGPHGRRRRVDAARDLARRTGLGGAGGRPGGGPALTPLSRPRGRRGVQQSHFPAVPPQQSHFPAIPARRWSDVS